MKTDSQDIFKLVKMNVLLCDGKKPALMSQDYIGKKGRSRCRTAARLFYQMTGQPTEVYQTGGPNSRHKYYYIVADAAVQKRGRIITRYGAISEVTSQEQMYA